AVPAAAAPSPAETPGDALLHAVGDVTTSVAETPEAGAEYRFTLTTDEGASFAISGAFDQPVKGAVRLDGTFLVPAEVAAAAGLAPGAVAEADSEVGAAVIAAATEPLVTVESTRVTAPQARPGSAAIGATAHGVDVAIITSSPRGANYVPTNQQIIDAVAATSAYWVDGTAGGISAIQVNGSPVRYATGYDCAAGDPALAGMLNEAAAKFGHAGASYYEDPLSPARHLLVILPDTSSCPSLSWGFAHVGTDAASSGWIVMPARSTSYTPTLVHEFGHNIGMLHSYAIANNCDTSVLWLEPSCGAYEYWDLYSPMGLEVLPGGGPEFSVPALDAAHRAYFGFPADYAVTHPAGTVATYQLRTLDGAAPTSSVHKTIRVDEPGTGRMLFIEYRAGTGTDAAAVFMDNGGQIGRTSTNSGWTSCSEPSASCTSGYGYGSGVRVVEAVPPPAGEPGYGPGGAFWGATAATPVVTNASYPGFRELAEEAGEEYVSTNGGVRVRILSTSGGIATVEVQSGASLTAAPVPVIAGKPKAGETLTAQVGTWSPAPVTTTIEWLRDGVVVATGPSDYVVQPGDVGHSFQVRVTGSKVGYVSASRTSSIVKIWSMTTYPDPLQNFVAQANRDFIGSELSDPAVAYWAGWTSTNGRSAFISQLATSSEWVRAIVNGFYQDTLGRAGEANGVNFWSNQIATRQMTVATVAAQFYSSNEYFNNIGGGTNASWVTDLYQKLMFRTPSTTERNFWVGQIASGSMNRLQVASFFYGSIEKRRLRVNELYEKILNRTLPTTDSGYAFWADWLSTHDDIDLAVVLATTGNEYFDKAQTPH
ncbi:MAG: DUF4214 domain-containing protein, partial [Microbacteriaceae bacterium]|nr:DUF4214 domain-containing protein [Microbacteriaceae bacterium]